MILLEGFKDNLVLVSCDQTTGKKFKRQKVSLKNVETFLSHLKLIIPYFCQHPQSIIEEIDALKEDGLESVLKELHKLMTQENNNVWNGTIGEAIASFYILNYTEYKIPVFKLRFAPNRKMAMHGDDVLGFQFNNDGTPKALLVTEVKNYGKTSPKEAVKRATEGLLKVQESSVTLLDFIFNILSNAQKYDEARQVKRFNDSYNYSYDTEYLAFVITEENNWKDEYFDSVVEGIKVPLTVNAFLISNWTNHQTELVSKKDTESLKLSLPTVGIEDIQDVKNILNNSIFKTEHNQLASEALIVELKNQRRTSISYRYDRFRLEKAANFLASKCC